MIWHGLLGRKIAEYRNPSNILYKSLPSYFVEFFWKAALLILAFKRDIYKHDSSREESLSSLPEVEWAVAESQRGMAQDEVKLVCRRATHWTTGIFLRGRIEFFTGGWVSRCWVPKSEDAENEKNNYNKNESNRKGKYKHFVWCNLMSKKVFSFFSKDLQRQS